MAKYHENLKYHKDTVKKRALREDDVQFLLKLQKEMNTQDTLYQADPRFWVIQGRKKEYGIEDGYEDGTDLVDSDGYTVATDLNSATEYIKEYLIDDINDTDGVK